jgi:DUF971 family protein
MRPDLLIETPSNPEATGLTLHQQSRQLEVSFADGVSFRLSYEFLRVHSPSAEVKGHGPGQEVLQTGKRDVDLVGLEPVGHYAVQPTFSDGHDSGIYTWAYLYQLGANQDLLWQQYETALAAAGVTRDTPMVKPAASACSTRG